MDSTLSYYRYINYLLLKGGHMLTSSARLSQIFAHCKNPIQEVIVKWQLQSCYFPVAKLFKFETA